MSEYNSMCEWMEKQSKVKDQSNRETFFLVQWDDSVVEQFWHDDTQTPPTVWNRQIRFTQKTPNVTSIDVGDYLELEKDFANGRWENLVKEFGYVRWTPYAPECHQNENESKMNLKRAWVKFHRIVKNEDDVYQTLWSDHEEKHFFTVSASTLLGEVNETMCFRSDENGRFTGADECGVVYPASRVLDVHGKLAKDAWNALQMDMATA